MRSDSLSQMSKAAAPPEPIGLEFVTSTETAARQIMEWRNDPQTLANSNNTKPKSWPSFFAEFLEEYQADPTLPCLFIVSGNRRVGFIRFRRISRLLKSQRCCDISINLAPSERGKGIARAAIEQALQIPRNGGVDLVIADIQPENAASIKMFRNAGFLPFVEESEVAESPTKSDLLRFARTTVKSFTIAGTNRKVGPGHSCFIIAEAGSNWRMGTYARDVRMGKSLIDVAAEAGADAVKFQTYQASTTYVANAGTSDYLSTAGIKESISDIFADLTMPHEMLPELAAHAAKQNILFMSSPFSVVDFQAVDPFVAIHKIASYEISHLRLIEAIANSGKPAILSTGASEIADIEWAVHFFQSLSLSTLSLMQCTAKYPAELSDLNLGTIPLLKAKFGLPVGLSDHSRDPIAGPMAAVALGANLIEKHYTLDNRLPGPDHAFAVTASELKLLVEMVRKVEQTMGSACKNVQPAELELLDYARRGIQALKEIEQGEKLAEGINFDILRPGKQRRGTHSKNIPHLQNARANRKIPPGDGIHLSDCDPA